MILFIFESIGTAELIMIGIIALIFLGPRKLPEIARKMGKIMADFRNTTSEFKETWEREVNFEEEAKALRTAMDDDPIPRERQEFDTDRIAAPEIKQIDSAAFDGAAATDVDADTGEVVESEDRRQADVVDTGSEKKNWL
ncbi:MAG: Sec-independent protein translocase protein TatB [Pyrinomonadaceae bacterium]